MGDVVTAIIENPDAVAFGASIAISASLAFAMIQVAEKIMKRDRALEKLLEHEDVVGPEEMLSYDDLIEYDEQWISDARVPMLGSSTGLNMSLLLRKHIQRNTSEYVSIKYYYRYTAFARLLSAGVMLLSLTLLTQTFLLTLVLTLPTAIAFTQAVLSLILAAIASWVLNKYRPVFSTMVKLLNSGFLHALPSDSRSRETLYLLVSVPMFLIMPLAVYGFTTEYSKSLYTTVEDGDSLRILTELLSYSMASFTLVSLLGLIGVSYYWFRMLYSKDYN